MNYYCNNPPCGKLTAKYGSPCPICEDVRLLREENAELRERLAGMQGEANGLQTAIEAVHDAIDRMASLNKRAERVADVMKVHDATMDALTKPDITMGVPYGQSPEHPLMQKALNNLLKDQFLNPSSIYQPSRNAGEGMAQRSAAIIDAETREVAKTLNHPYQHSPNTTDDELKVLHEKHDALVVEYDEAAAAEAKDKPSTNGDRMVTNYDPAAEHATQEAEADLEDAQ